MLNKEDFDLDALYLYKHYDNYRVGFISKINKCSITMSNGDNIKQFDCFRKLTNEERKVYEFEIIKGIKNGINKVHELTGKIKRLKSLLSMEEFIMLDTKKLQNEIDKVADILSGYDLTPFRIGEKKFKLPIYGSNLEEVE